MHAASSFEPSPATLGELIVHHIATAAQSRRARTGSKVRRRSPTRIQGKALETLGHAIEYLVDSRIHRDRDLSSSADCEAEQIMMRLSREVFAECAAVVPSGGLASWLVKVLTPAEGQVR
jgi:hypothetical protein